MKLELLKYSNRIRKSPSGNEVFDPVRKKYVQATPEEFVRQLLIQCLIDEFSCPPGLISVERMVNYAGLSLRYDLAVYDRKSQPWLLVEIKAPRVSLHEETAMQLSRYNHGFLAPYLLITNGPDALLWERMQSHYQIIERLPIYPLAGV